jgi:hypothetical protein
MSRARSLAHTHKHNFPGCQVAPASCALISHRDAAIIILFNWHILPEYASLFLFHGQFVVVLVQKLSAETFNVLCFLDAWAWKNLIRVIIVPASAQCFVQGNKYIVLFSWQIEKKVVCNI